MAANRDRPAAAADRGRVDRWAFGSVLWPGIPVHRGAGWVRGRRRSGGRSRGRRRRPSGLRRLVAQRARDAPGNPEPSGGPDDGAPAGDRRDRDRGDWRRVQLGDVQRPACRWHVARGSGSGLRAGRGSDSFRRARQTGDGGPRAGRSRGWDRAVERAGDPRHARGGDAAGVREHGGVEGVRDLSAYSRDDRSGPHRRRPAAGA